MKLAPLMVLLVLLTSGCLGVHKVDVHDVQKPTQTIHTPQNTTLNNTNGWEQQAIDAITRSIIMVIPFIIGIILIVIILSVWTATRGI